MKKLLFIIAIAITGVASAQTISESVNDVKDTSVSISTSTGSKSIAGGKEVQEQIKEQLVKNEELGTMAIGHLKSDPEAKSMLGKLYSENKGSVSGIMKSVMSDPKLSSKVMDWVNNNPKVLEKAMSLVGM